MAYLESSSRTPGVPVLDAGNDAFGPLIRLLPGAGSTGTGGCHESDLPAKCGGFMAGATGG